MKLGVWKISRKIWHYQQFQRQLPTLLQRLVESQLLLVMNRPVEKGLNGVVGQCTT